MEKKKQNRYCLEELTDQYIGKIGTPERDSFEKELRLDHLGSPKNYQKVTEQLRSNLGNW